MGRAASGTTRSRSGTTRSASGCAPTTWRRWYAAPLLFAGGPAGRSSTCRRPAGRATTSLRRTARARPASTGSAPTWPSSSRQGRRLVTRCIPGTWSPPSSSSSSGPSDGAWTSLARRPRSSSAAPSPLSSTLRPGGALRVDPVGRRPRRRVRRRRRERTPTSVCLRTSPLTRCVRAGPPPLHGERRARVGRKGFEPLTPCASMQVLCQLS